MTRSLALLLLLGALLVLTTIHHAPEPVDPTPLWTPPQDVWTPPPWLEGGPVSAWALPVVEGEPRHDQGPDVQAPAALIADLDRGEVLWARLPDERRPVASVTKLVSALTLVAEGADLDRELCVGPEQYPTKPGARSRFETGVCHPGWDWLGAALVRSDNRGAMGFPALAGHVYQVFVDRMVATSRELGLSASTWTDPSGIEDTNRASARDVARAAIAAAAHPLISEVSSAEHWHIQRRSGHDVLPSTNRLADRWQTLSAKTGYTDAAGYCFTTVVRSDGGGLYAIVVLGAPSSPGRFRDAERMVDWADSLGCAGADGQACTSAR